MNDTTGERLKRLNVALTERICSRREDQERSGELLLVEDWINQDRTDSNCASEHRVGASVDLGVITALDLFGLHTSARQSGTRIES
jgi:hypothetical protein